MGAISRKLLADLGVAVPPKSGRAATTPADGCPVWLALLRAWCAAEGHPAPATEHEFHPTRLWRFDACWPDRRIALEVEGVTRAGGRHQRTAGYSEDCLKYSWASILGWTLVRVTPGMVRDGRAWELLAAAFAGRAAGPRTITHSGG